MHVKFCCDKKINLESLALNQSYAEWYNRGPSHFQNSKKKTL